MNDPDSPEAWREKGFRAAQKIGYKLPAGITMTRGPASSGIAYYFRHNEFGEIGRARLIDAPGGGGRLLGEVAGEPNDPLMPKRLELLGPLIRQLHHVLDESAGVPHQPSQGLSPPHQMTHESAGVLQVKVMYCETCDAPVARLVFAPPGTQTSADFMDVARRSFAICNELALPTWIVGPGNEQDILTKIDPMDIRSTVMQIWPEYGDRFESSPAEFNATVEALQQNHCAL